jgi:hypothetical protein
LKGLALGTGLLPFLRSRPWRQRSSGLFFPKPNEKTLFASLRIYTWWFGALAGLAHGIFVLACALPLLPYVHPRTASEYHAANAIRQLEPPGFLAMNYGYHTPLTTLFGQVVYGALLGGFLQAERLL